MKRKKIKEILVPCIEFIFNPRFLLCFGLAWFITNGWSYIVFVIGTYFQIGWMIAVASAYLAFLWLPVSPEKLVTLTIAMLLLRKLFPNDTKTWMVLQKLHEKLKNKKQEVKENRKQKKKK